MVDEVKQTLYYDQTVMQILKSHSNKNMLQKNTGITCFEQTRESTF